MNREKLMAEIAEALAQAEYWRNRYNNSWFGNGKFYANYSYWVEKADALMKML